MNKKLPVWAIAPKVRNGDVSATDRGWEVEYKKTGKIELLISHKGLKAKIDNLDVGESTPEPENITETNSVEAVVDVEPDLDDEVDDEVDEDTGDSMQSDEMLELSEDPDYENMTDEELRGDSEIPYEDVPDEYLTGGQKSSRTRAINKSNKDS